jgi:hypothetical protein
MPILGPNAEQSVIGRILLATGLGAIFGFQVRRLAELGFAASVPWYALAWLFLSYVFLGLSVGAEGSTRWWKRGLVFGLVFSIPSAFGAHTLGLRWVPYGVAAIICCHTASSMRSAANALLGQVAPPCYCAFQHT